MPKRRPLRIARDQPGGINPGSFGRNTNLKPISISGWANQMSRSEAGASEVMVRITGGAHDSAGVHASMEYVDRHGQLEVEDDRGQVNQGKLAATEKMNDWALEYGRAPGAPHSRKKLDADGKPRQGPKQAFNIALSMPRGTPPELVLEAARKFARENFANQHRYLMVLHTNDKQWNEKHNPGFKNEKDHGANPHVHLIVKAEHEYGGPRLNPRKADLQRWREQFADYMTELGVLSTATRRHDRGLIKTAKKTPIYRAMQRNQATKGKGKSTTALYTEAGDSVFMRRKLEAIKKELRERGSVEDKQAYQALLNVRSAVNSRYDEAAAYMRSQGREAEARRFEATKHSLPAVRTEKQMIADAFMAQARGGREAGREEQKVR